MTEIFEKFYSIAADLPHLVEVVPDPLICQVLVLLLQMIMLACGHYYCSLLSPPSGAGIVPCLFCILFSVNPFLKYYRQWLRFGELQVNTREHKMDFCYLSVFVLQFLPHYEKLFLSIRQGTAALGREKSMEIAPSLICFFPSIHMDLGQFLLILPSCSI